MLYFYFSVQKHIDRAFCLYKCFILFCFILTLVFLDELLWVFGPCALPVGCKFKDEAIKTQCTMDVDAIISILMMMIMSMCHFSLE